MGLNMLEQAIVTTTPACSHIRQAVFRFRTSRIKRFGWEMHSQAA